MKEKFEIEGFILEISEAIDILKCFNEFCDESILPEGATDNERQINAICFVNRMRSHRALLNVAIKNLENNVKSLNSKLGLTK